MKTTALTSVHEAMGAKMVEFAGYKMPIQYSGLLQEHEAVRERAGMFDVSHMGEFYVTGPKAIELLQKVTSNDVSKLEDGKVQYSCFPNHQGGIVDDLLVYRFNAEKYMLVVNASNIEKDWNWVQQNNQGIGADLHNASDDMALLAVQGPKATAILQKLTDVTLSDIPYYTFKVGTFAGVQNVIISCTGYTGSGGFELYLPNAAAELVWHTVLEAGKDEGILPAGLGARDTLRLEMAFCLYGNDINDTTSPLEAGLGWITKFTKPFINAEGLKLQKEQGLKRKLVGFEMIDKGIPRKDYPIVDANGAVIGVVTSGTQSPSLQKAIGLGYVTSSHAAVDSEIFIEVRGKQLRAKVVKTPFYTKPA